MDGLDAVICGLNWLNNEDSWLEERNFSVNCKGREKHDPLSSDKLGRSGTAPSLNLRKKTQSTTRPATELATVHQDPYPCLWRALRNRCSQGLCGSECPCRRI